MTGGWRLGKEARAGLTHNLWGETSFHIKVAESCIGLSLASPLPQSRLAAVQVYAKYAPFQFLAYWHELWRDYEAQFGSFASMDPRDYVLLTGTSQVWYPGYPHERPLSSGTCTKSD